MPLPPPPSRVAGAPRSSALAIIHAAKNVPVLCARFTALKWVFLITIAIVTAVVGFAQSMLVASIYKLRTEMLYGLVASSAAAASSSASGPSSSSSSPPSPLWLPALLKAVALNAALASAASLSAALISPAAAGSGIPDVKAYLNGAETPREVFRDFFTPRTFFAKVVGSALAVASSLCVGKEGPMLHAGSILAVLLGRHGWFRQDQERRAGDDEDEDEDDADADDNNDNKTKKKKTTTKRGPNTTTPATASYASYGPSAFHGPGRDLRDLVSCGAACGVTTAFRAPVGGVLFAMEIATRWSKELTWRCFLASAVSVLAVRASVSACASRGLCGQLRWASLAYLDAASYPPSVGLRHAPQLLALAAFGGWLGAMFTQLNTWVCLARKKWARRKAWRIAEVAALSFLTSCALLALPLVARTCSPCATGDQTHCVGGGAASFRTFPGFGCPAGTFNDAAALTVNPQGFLLQALFAAPPKAFHIGALAAFGALFFLLAALTYGAFIPSGLFTVGLIFGGCLGRVWADALLRLGLLELQQLDDSGMVGMHALLGAAAFLGGLMRMSASMCLILMEMTGAPHMLPYLMITLVVAKGVGDRFCYSVFDHQCVLKKLGMIGMAGGQPDKVLRTARLTAADVMSPAAGLGAAAGGDDDGAGGSKQEGGKEGPKVARTAALRVLETRQGVARALDRHRDASVFAVVAGSAAAGEGEEEGEEDGPAFLGMVSRGALLDLMRRRGGQQQQRQRRDDDGDDPASPPPPPPPPPPLLDLAPLVEAPPVVVPPSMPLALVYALMQDQGIDCLPVIRRHGPLEGLVTRPDVVAVQHRLLDPLSLRDRLQQQEDDLRAGRVLASLQLERQYRALGAAVAAPLVAARDILMAREEGREGGAEEGEGERRTAVNEDAPPQPPPRKPPSGGDAAAAAAELVEDGDETRLLQPARPPS